MSEIVSIRQETMPHLSSNQTEKKVISLPRRFPCTKRRYRKSGNIVSIEQSSSSSMTVHLGFQRARFRLFQGQGCRTIFHLDRLFSDKDVWRATRNLFD